MVNKILMRVFLAGFGTASGLFRPVFNVFGPSLGEKYRAFSEVTKLLGAILIGERAHSTDAGSFDNAKAAYRPRR